MKKTLLISSLFLISLGTVANAQSENALFFDNIDDQVVVASGSSAIAGSTAMSLTMWVNPQNPFPAFPDFDGFAGIRNNADADFYMLHLNTTEVEARFRNSTGVNYDVVASGITLNTWQHLEMTYEGTTLTVYLNGVVAGSTPATGTIANSFEDFLVGNLLYQGTNFWFNGQLDEVSLWSKSLTPAEINCMINGAIDPTSPNLELYYRFNQGVAGGTNTTVTTLTDVSGNINGTLSGFGLAGATSNWVAGVTTANSTTIADVICPGSTYIFGTQTLTAPGNYFEAFPLAGGCDSIVQLVLTAPVINTAISQSGPVLTAQQAGLNYQWINCTTLLPVAGATQQQFTATVNGQYAVVISVGSCSDTSFCANVTNVGLTDINGSAVQVGPNPFTDQVTIDAGTLAVDAIISVTDISGRMITQFTNKNRNRIVIDTKQWNKGIYLLRISDTSGYLKLVKM
ncbi:MAG: hypothetical protein BWY67_00862 [Bacteroidetes bacterium ADurb.Bin397]|nr:MAG: hypothetical protein BWY67_00862 [Bacteroidetes bacterium ADurb.Bin397]